jgi:hypothetical protein
MATAPKVLTPVRGRVTRVPRTCVSSSAADALVGEFVNRVGSTCAPGDVLELEGAVVLVPETVLPGVVVVPVDVVVVPVDVVVVVSEGVVVVVVDDVVEDVVDDVVEDVLDEVVDVVGVVCVPEARQYALFTSASSPWIRSRFADPAAYSVPCHVVACFHRLFGSLRCARCASYFVDGTATTM